MIDDFVITRLDLSLPLGAGYGNSQQPDTRERAREKTKRLDDDDDDDDDCHLSCLTLGLPDSTTLFGPIAQTDSGKLNNGSPHGSESSLKAEVGEAVEVAGAVRKSYNVEEEDEGSTRKKLRLSKQQKSVLEEYFNANTTINGSQKQDLANKLNLRPRQVEVWFQNRRARTKLKQTEVDRKLLRKCCETLKEDNAKLKMELQRLRSTNLNDAEEPSISTVSVCPSCETSVDRAAS